MPRTIDPDFRALFESAPGPYLILTPDSHFEIMAVSDAYTQATKTKREEILGRKLFDVFPDNPEDLQSNGTGHLRASLERVLKNRTSDRMDIQKYDIPRPISEGGGFEMRYWSPFNSPVLRDNGKLYAIIHHVEDVTDVMRLKLQGMEQDKIIRSHDLARRTIENERNNFRNLFKETPEMVCILKGPHHLFEFVNEAHVKALGFDATGMTLREAQPESVEVHGILDQVYNDGQTAELCETPITLTNRLRYFNLTYSPSRDENGNINGVLILGMEVTDQVLSRENLRSSQEQLEKANRSKDEFLSIASHELRTPLTAMKMLTQMFHRTINKDESAAFQPAKVISLVDKFDRGLNRLIRLVEDMLDMSRIQNGKLTFQHEHCEIASFLSETLDRLRPELAMADIELRTELTPGLTTKLDCFRIEQVLINLVSNAVRYAPNTPLDVVLKKVGSNAVITFQDHGPGIPDADKEKVFIQFERLVSAHSVSGMGLGLYICRKIIEGLGGSIKVGKGTGAGALFVIELPLVDE